MKLDILVFAAHPDDAELSCGGILAKHVKLGYKVGICDLTLGELGTRGNAELRKIEAAKAVTILGIHARENLAFKDGFFSGTEEEIIKIITVIRKYQPKIILANAPEDRHPDHGRAATIIKRATFLAGLPKIFSEYNTITQTHWRTPKLYHYIQERYLSPTFVVDISNEIEQKLAAIQAYSSQFYSSNSNEPETIISKQDYFEFVKARAKTMGQPVGYLYAEGLIADTTVGISDLFSI